MTLPLDRAPKGGSNGMQHGILPMSNQRSEFKLTYLRAQEEFEALLPDLSVSSRVYFLSNFLVSENHFENYFFGLENHVM